MKIKDGFVMREAGGCFVIMNLGSELNLGKMFTLNETGAFIWKSIEKGLSQGEIAKKLSEEYNVDAETAQKDVEGFICKMKEADVFE
ncbi:MAG: PqqD family protein [Ruminococcaceae bacterium]|nr:PqqD family protein [Oscillospiraceae bacterium]